MLDTYRSPYETSRHRVHASSGMHFSTGSIGLLCQSHPRWYLLRSVVAIALLLSTC